MSGHHSSNCHFLIKVQQALAYLKMEPKAPSNKRNHYTGKNTYHQQNNFVRSLQDAGFIPYDEVDADNFLDIVNDDHDVFTPDIINSINAVDSTPDPLE